MTATEARPARDVSVSGRLRAYVGLTKPASSVLLVTTVPTMFLAAGVSVRLDHDRHVGGRGAGGRGANTLNSLHRPRHRQADGADRASTARDR